MLITGFVIFAAVGINLAKSLLEPLLLLVIIIFGIALALGSVGIKVKGSVTTSIVDNIFREIGYVCRRICQGIWYLCRWLYRLTPRVFRRIRTFCQNRGASGKVSNVVATLLTILILIIII